MNHHRESGKMEQIIKNRLFFPTYTVTHYCADTFFLKLKFCRDAFQAWCHLIKLSIIWRKSNTITENVLKTEVILSNGEQRSPM